MSDSLQPYGLQPTRFLCPWDSPGKKTGAGCPKTWFLTLLYLCPFLWDYICLNGFQRQHTGDSQVDTCGLDSDTTGTCLSAGITWSSPVSEPNKGSWSAPPACFSHTPPHLTWWRLHPSSRSGQKPQSFMTFLSHTSQPPTCQQIPCLFLRHPGSDHFNQPSCLAWNWYPALTLASLSAQQLEGWGLPWWSRG